MGKVRAARCHTGGLVDVEGGRQLAAHIPGAQYAELPGADHLPFVGNGDRIIHIIGGFLQHPKRREASNRAVATILLIRSGAKAAARISDAEAPVIDEELRRFRATRVPSWPAGIAATFDGPARALECAVSVSRLLRDRRPDHRIGMHTGEINLETGILQGTAVDIAADVSQPRT